MPKEDFSWGRRGAGLLIKIADSDKVLLVHRSRYVLDPGLWGLPGGRVEPGETDFEAAIREGMEELWSLPLMQIIGKFSTKTGEFTYTTFLAVVLWAIAEAWEPVLNWEHDEWRWFSTKKLPKNTHPGVKVVL